MLERRLLLLHCDKEVLDALIQRRKEQRAVPLHERYQVVKIVQASNGFTPLHVMPDGDLGVGAEQYTASQGCASFGCSLSALPGSYSAQDDSLGFDATCHTGKVAAQRRAEREAKAAQVSAASAQPSRQRRHGAGAVRPPRQPPS